VAEPRQRWSGRQPMYLNVQAGVACWSGLCSPCHHSPSVAARASAPARGRWHRRNRKLRRHACCRRVAEGVRPTLGACLSKKPSKRRWESANSPERNTLRAPMLLYGGVYNPCRPDRKHGAAYRCRCARLHFQVRRERSHDPLVTHPRFAFRSGMRENVPVA
jgi:hypothetical protein